MKKKDLIEAIELGMNNHVNWIVWQVLKGLLLALVLVIIVWIFVLFHTARYPQEQSVEMESSCFPYENLICDIVVQNETTQGSYSKFAVCGYQEANAYYEQLKLQIEEELKKSHSTLKIKYLDCH